MWRYNPVTDALTLIAHHDRARLGDINMPATPPYNQDEETPGTTATPGATTPTVNGHPASARHEDA